MSTAEQAGTSMRTASNAGRAEPVQTASDNPPPAGDAAASPPPVTGPTPSSPSQPTPSRGPARRVRLTVSRIDPWSAMKLSFLVSVALGIALVVMVAVLWMILKGMGVFDQVNELIGSVLTNQDGQSTFDLMDFFGFGRVVSLSVVVAVIDVVLLTAIATLTAFLYNVSANLVDGLVLTLTDD